VTFKVVCDGGTAYSTATVLDASEEGVFVRSKRLLPEGTKVHLTPIGAAAEIFELPATVVRVVESEDISGMALRFGQVEEEDRKTLRQLLTELPPADPADVSGPHERYVYGDPIRPKIRTRARLIAGTGVPRGWPRLRS
jgi:hypothetical protein